MVRKIPRKTQTKGERHEREGLGFRVQGLGGGHRERYVWRFRCVGTFVNFEKMGWGFSSVPA
jgi:hypothetical protein